MNVYRRVINREINDTTATETLECGHTNVLYRRVQGKYVAWYNHEFVSTSLNVTSRECLDCEREEEAQEYRKWEL